jgi:hypothetical protein
MNHLAFVGLGLAFLVAGPAFETTPTPVVSDSPTTSCQCIAVTCGNGSTAPACQVTCAGQAVCACAYCIARAGGSSSISGLNSCMCR